MNIFQKSIKTIRRDGIKKFLYKAIRLTKMRLHEALYLIPALIKVSHLEIKNIDNLIEFSYNSCGGILKPGQIKSEIRELLKIFVKLKPKTIMEIGTARGGTLFLFTKLAPEDAKIISIDLPWGPFGGGYPLWKIPLFKAFAKNKQKIYLLRMDSHNEETLKKVKRILGKEKIDFLFIDADHSYEGVKKDFEMYGHLVKKGGIIAFHDIVKHPPETGCEVDKFWNRIKKKYKHFEIVEDLNQGGFGMGVIYV